jgi:uncharacterized phage infection (PIP) family protein YhgE
MNLKTGRAIGILLISAAILGWLLSLSTLAATWIIRPKLTQAVVSQVEMLTLTLEVTTKGLAVSQESLAAIVASLDTLQSTVQKTAGVVDGATPFIDSLANISAENLPKAIDGLRTSMETAQQGAKVIDDALRKVTNLPLIGDWLSNQGYNPTTPLDQGLSQVAEGINQLDDTFQGITDNLNSTRDSLLGVKDGINSMADDIGEVKDNLQETQDTLAAYQETTQAALDFLNRWSDRFPQLITFAAVFLSLVLVWIAITQVGLFLQGRSYFSKEEKPGG